MKTPTLSSLALSLFLGNGAWADIKLPAIISENMVLQQETRANVWGWAEPGEAVEIQFGAASGKTVTGADGKWDVKLTQLAAGSAGDMVIKGKNSITVKNVIAGEVWVCSGQSNMEWNVADSKNPQDEIAAADFPELRMFTVKKSAQAEPQTDCVGKWEVCTPQTVPHFSAVGYYFGRKLLQDVKRPVGLIHTSWGGTPAEYWTPKEVLAGDPDLKPLIDEWDNIKAAYPKAKETFDKATADWQVAAERAKADGTPVPQAPHRPKGGDAKDSPASLFNGMIAPILPYTIQGATWYQGEANASRAKEYQKLFPMMIMSWRLGWRAELPFLFVQLANFNARNVDFSGQPEDSRWAELREAQLMTLDLARTGMAVAIDIGDPKDIHPKNKQEVGRRLALIAQASVYFQEVPDSGPLYTGHQQEGDKIRLNFRHSEDLKASDGGKIKGFAIAGEDQKFVWADITIEGDHVLVSSPQVAKPVAVRYGWADNPECNLVNAANLPASPFRTDRWPQFTPTK